MSRIADARHARPRSALAAGGAAPRRRFPKSPAAAGLLAGAWLLPIITQALHADWLLLVVLLIGIGSLLRAGYFLLDRLMLAGILLTGTLIAGGLLFSFWPWGLEPVAVAGTLLTILVAVGVLTGRRPSLPTRLRGSDAIIVGAGVVTAWIMRTPIAGRSFVGQLPLMTNDEDKFNHFAIFDTIQRLGGYPFLHAAKASTSLEGTTPVAYPQGSHYLYAVLDIFLRSTTSVGPMTAEYSRYFTYTLIGYGFLVIAVTWSARWVAGPAISGWSSVLICSVVAPLTAFGPFTGLIESAFDSATIGLAMLALTVAVTARPAGRTREQVLVVAAALVALFYAYNLIGFMAGLGILAAVVIYRRRLLRQWVFTAVTAVVAVAVALLPTVMAESSGFSATQQLDLGSTILPLSRPVLGGLALVAVVTMATKTGRRSGAWRAFSAQLGVAAAVTMVAFFYQEYTLGHVSYYFYKILIADYVIWLVGVGAYLVALVRIGAGLLVEPGRTREGVPRRPLWRSELLPGLAGSLIAIALACGLIWSPAAIHGPRARSWVSTWLSGKDTSPVWPALGVLDRAHVLGDGKPTLVLYANWERDNWLATFFGGVLNRDLSAVYPTIYSMYNLGPIMGSGNSSYDRIRLANDVKVERLIIAGGVRHLRVIVSDSGFDATLKSFAAAHPDLGLTVVYMPQLSANPAAG
jgi:hypothetical protein